MRFIGVSVMKKRETKGMISISIGYLIWGLLPLYWNLINYVSALEILLHRVLWSLVLCILYFVLIKKNAFSLIKKTLQTKHIALLFLSATLLFLNWLSYIYAVTSNHLLQASMGYFISPLLIVFFALVLFKEKMGRLQVIALLVCALGVVYTTVQVGVVPYLSLAIGLTFSSYTICKKYINLDGIQSLLIDTVLITPIVIAMMIYMGIKGISLFLTIS
ncbi:MAG: EamA family transporter RarD, partial [Spirochaetia bacterium]|nr:EamA family transporter RarD [Spirochaetia bacterium]